MYMKQCKTCNIIKLSSDFNIKKTSKDGYQSSCRNCQKNYRFVNKDKIDKLLQDYKEQNKDKIKEKRKLKYIKNKNIIKEQSKVYYKNNKKQILYKKKQYLKKYRLENKLKIKEYVSKHNKEKRQQNPMFRLKANMRSAISTAIKNKNKTTTKILGCSYEDLKKYLESKFEPWMNWDNYGDPKDGILELNKTWDIDHIEPLSSAKTEEDIIRLNHYTNLQPLCSYYNRHIKKNFLIKPNIK